MREDSAHARNHDLSAAAEIVANSTHFPNTLRIIPTVALDETIQRLGYGLDVGRVRVRFLAAAEDLLILRSKPRGTGAHRCPSQELKWHFVCGEKAKGARS